MDVRVSEYDDFWDGWLDTTDSECVVVLKAYFDASTRKGSGLLCVAGYLFESGRVRRFRQQWRDTFGSAAFSWADLVACRKPFEHLRDENDDVIKAKLDPLVKAGVRLVRDYVIGGTVVSCWKQDLDNFGPTWIKGFGHAYSVAGHMAISGMGQWAKHNGYRGGIEYAIEAGDEGYDQLAHLLSYASKENEFADLYQWNGHYTAPKTGYSPFNAPDLLAWEFGKYWQETVMRRGEPNYREIRGSLVHLLIDRMDRYSFMHLHGPSLLKFFDSIHELGMDQLEQARAQFSTSSSVDVGEELNFSGQTEPVGGPE